MEALTIGDAAAQTGWSARMLRYLETVGSSFRRGRRPATGSTAPAS